MIDKKKAHVTTNILSGVQHIEFYNPAHNALPTNLLVKLVAAFDAAKINDEVKIVVLKSGGDRTFCAGASFDELMNIKDPNQGKQFFMGFCNVIKAIRDCGKLVIGRVQGKSVGGGIGLAAAVDYCIGTKYSSVRLSELAVGIGPFVIGPAVQRKIGVSAFSQLSLDAGQWKDAQWARQKGLFTHVFESATEMDNYIEEFTTKLSRMNPEALALLKKIFWEGTEHWDALMEDRAQMSGTLVLSDFTRSAIQKFRDKT